MKYPPVFFVTATSDDRVTPVHARKMAAKMEAQGHEVLFYENTDGGHAAAADHKQAAEMWALSFVYLAQKLGLIDRRRISLARLAGLNRHAARPAAVRHVARISARISPPHASREPILSRRSVTCRLAWRCGHRTTAECVRQLKPANACHRTSSAA